MRRWRRTGVVAMALLTAALVAPPGVSGAQEQVRKTRNTEVGGHLAPPQSGGFGDVWAHKNVAYLGSLRQEDCDPPNGVWAIDLQDPARPRALASFAKFPGSDGEDVWVGSVRTRAFKGDLAAVGLQRCSRQADGFAGLALYDVTDPAKPKELGRLATGATCASSTSPTRGGRVSWPTGTSAATGRPTPGASWRPGGTCSTTAPGRSTTGTSCSRPSGGRACSSWTSATRPRPG